MSAGRKVWLSLFQFTTLRDVSLRACVVGTCVFIGVNVAASNWATRQIVERFPFRIPALRRQELTFAQITTDDYISRMAKDRSIVAIGDCFTFGHAVKHPYTHYLAELMKTPVLNLSLDSAFSSDKLFFYKELKRLAPNFHFKFIVNVFPQELLENSFYSNDLVFDNQLLDRSDFWTDKLSESETFDKWPVDLKKVRLTNALAAILPIFRFSYLTVQTKSQLDEGADRDEVLNPGDFKKMYDGYQARSFASFDPGSYIRRHRTAAPLLYLAKRMQDAHEPAIFFVSPQARPFFKNPNMELWTQLFPELQRRFREVGVPLYDFSDVYPSDNYLQDPVHYNTPGAIYIAQKLANVAAGLGW